MRMTSANANKVIKKLQDEKQFLLSKERRDRTYTATDAEEPVIPNYSYEDTSAELRRIDTAIVKIKHALNIVNSTEAVDVNGKSMHIDEILIRMAQLNSRKDTLDSMGGIQKKTRVRSISTNAVPEYQYINYDADAVDEDYKSHDAEITAMQLALDRFNQTFEFDVDVVL